MNILYNIIYPMYYFIANKSVKTVSVYLASTRYHWMREEILYRQIYVSFHSFVKVC